MSRPTTAAPARLGIFGARGRMGQRVVACLAEHPGLELSEAIHRASPAGAFDACDVVIDVSVAAATDELLTRLAGTRAALVTGVTGRSPAQVAAVEARAAVAPVFVAANFSLGVAVLSRLVQRAATMLQGFDAEIFEIHHRHKLDAPSGTALHLGRAVADARGLPWPESRALRDGPTGPRRDDEVGLAAVRGGGVTGEHTVYFFGPGERVELTHRAADRSVFAHGALRAARWVVGRPAGLYDVDAMLG